MKKLKEFIAWLTRPRRLKKIISGLEAAKRFDLNKNSSIDELAIDTAIALIKKIQRKRDSI